ncbi:MAG: hypothetical protein LLG01_17370 [Planctomycetaceae bacterium]|nr:hypothetical protein [Planctomycetaceae bacterium]
MGAQETHELNSIDDIWPLQAALNKRAGFDTAALGEALKAVEAAGLVAAPGASGADAPAADPKATAALLAAGRALKCYIDALSAECHELQECLSWKHWYREAKEGRQYQLQDVQNARVEATDMLFFWISICQILGLDAQDVLRLYAKKLKINHRRQDESRSQAEHGTHEDENRQVV